MPRRPSRSTPILSWAIDTDLVALTLTLQPQTDLQFPTHYTTELHSWFLNQVRLTDPKLSAYLHDGQSEKAFTIAPLIGNIQTQARAAFAVPKATLYCSKDALYQWSISALSGSVCGWLQQWLCNPPSEMHLRSGTFNIQQWNISLPAITYETIWDKAEADNKDLSLTFTTPTSFRKRSNHMPLPIPENVFHSYLRRWNIFSHLEFDQSEFLDWVNECVVILRHEIRSQKTQAGKQGSVTGFVGAVQFGLTPKAKAEPEYVQLVRALIACAPYFGTGHKVTFGLGQSQPGWFVEPKCQQFAQGSTPKVALDAIPKPKIGARNEVEETIAPLSDPIVNPSSSEFVDRHTELKAFFFSRKKRQGGERAEKAAEMWATIIAKQEFGESLPEIAAALDLSYDTVKQYTKRARKVLEDL